MKVFLFHLMPYAYVDPDYDKEYDTCWVTYPNTKFEFINAAIGGTNSNFGRERFEQDVLKYKPDAVTIMFVLNDNSRTAE